MASPQLSCHLLACLRVVQQAGQLLASVQLPHLQQTRTRIGLGRPALGSRCRGRSGWAVNLASARAGAKPPASVLARTTLTSSGRQGVMWKSLNTIQLNRGTPRLHTREREEGGRRKAVRHCCEARRSMGRQGGTPCRMVVSAVHVQHQRCSLQDLDSHAKRVTPSGGYLKGGVPCALCGVPSAAAKLSDAARMISASLLLSCCCCCCPCPCCAARGEAAMAAPAPGSSSDAISWGETVGRVGVAGALHAASPPAPPCAAASEGVREMECGVPPAGDCCCASKYVGGTCSAEGRVVGEDAEKDPPRSRGCLREGGWWRK